MKLSENDEAELAKPVIYTYKDDIGQIKRDERVIEKCTGQRREKEGRKKEFEYEVKWLNKSLESNSCPQVYNWLLKP